MGTHQLARGHALLLRGHALVIAWARTDHYVGTHWSLRGHALVIAWARTDHCVGTHWSLRGHALVIAWARIIIAWAPINQFSLVYSWPFLVSMGHRSDGPKHDSKVDNSRKLDDVMQSLDNSYIPLMAGLVSISTRLNSTVLGFISVCKARGQDMLTCKVSRYCFLALHGSSVPNCSFVCVVYWTRFLHRSISPCNLFNGTSPSMQLIL